MSRKRTDQEKRKRIKLTRICIVCKEDLPLIKYNYFKDDPVHHRVCVDCKLDDSVKVTEAEVYNDLVSVKW